MPLVRLITAPLLPLYQTRPGRGRMPAVEAVLMIAATRPLLAKHGDQMPRREIDRFHVDGVDAVEFLFADFEHRPVHMGDAGIVDHDVDMAVAIERRRDQLRHVAVARDIGTEIGRAALALRTVDFFRDARAALVVDVVDDELRAFLGEALGDRLAEARAAAGDDRYLARQAHCCLPAPLSAQSGTSQRGRKVSPRI